MSNTWKPMSSAPTDGTPVIVFASGTLYDLPDLVMIARYDPEFEWTIDELRYPILWTEVPNDDVL